MTLAIVKTEKGLALIEERPDGTIIVVRKEIALSTDASGHGHDVKGRFSSVSHKERLEKKRTEGLKGKTTGVIRTDTGYKEYDKHGEVHYDKEGYIVHFEPHSGKSANQQRVKR